MTGLGVDVGSVNVRAALWSGGRVVWSGVRPVRGEVHGALRSLLGELARRAAPPGPLAVRTVGVGRARAAEVLGAALETVNEVVAVAEAARAQCPGARSLIEVGGHTSRWIALVRGEVESFALSEPCAAGTGAFIEQQAGRLQLDAAGLAEAALRARRGAPVAGRCSVFAKSDMIHLQQKGIPVEEIAYGLCLAVARNVVSTLLRGQRMPLPVALVGGTALSGGLRRALAEVIGVELALVQVPPLAPYFPALGAARIAATEGGEDLSGLLAGVGERAEVAPTASTSPRLPALVAPAGRSGSSPEPRFAGAGATVEGFIGVDVGSVSTNLVVLDRAAERVLDGIYLPTRGRPVDVLTEGLSQLRQRFGDRLRVLGLGTTGSGRHLAAALLGADVVQNEISCQLASALRYVPGADTVIEIGGQDSKFIRAEGGRLVDFTMNKICAAGTGSFLEEEARRLGVSIIGEFAERALEARAPVNLGCRCTVFMDSELVNALARDDSVPDLCAGLAYAIARNYLEKVVAGRPVGRRVVMQGGVASNRAVVAAFSGLLGREVQVHPHGRISGAIGAALAACAARANRARRARANNTAFRGLDALESESAPRVETFECARCENRCQVSRITVMTAKGRSRVHFGDACERYAARDGAPGFVDPGESPDLFAEREAALTGSTTPSGPDSAKVIGLPRASFLWGQLPFWTTLLTRLGLRVRLSRPTSPATVARGAARLPAETCLPIKLSFGHVQELLEDPAVDAVLVPAVGKLTNWEGEGAILCPYTDALPHMLAASLDPSRLLVPELELSEREAGLSEELTAHLVRFAPHVTEARVREAFRAAVAAQRGALARLRARGAEVLASRGAGPVLAVLGRPYTLSDGYLNLNLARHLGRLGVTALPLEMLPSPVEGLELGPLPWRFNRDILRTLRWVLDQPGLHPVLISSFGCGPDAFMEKHMKPMVTGRPHLELEFDEHRAEAGLITRLEAFLDEIGQHVVPPPPRREGRLVGRPIGRARGHYRGRRVWVPYYSDHSRAVAGAYRFAGLDARVLPPPDEALIAGAEAVGSGKECHPFTMVAADLDRVIADHRPGDLFWIVGSTLPCLIQQWSPAMVRMLEERGVDDLELLSPTMPDYWDLLGFEGYFRLYCGLFAVDLLVRAACALRPYEARPGTTDAIHAVNLQDLEQALGGGDVVAALRRCAGRLESVALRGPRRRPLVGVAGDIYTRINAQANRGLFAELEALGCEVWPAPFLVDLVEYGLVGGLRTALQQRQLRAAIQQAVVLTGQQLGNWLVRRGLGAPRSMILPWGESFASAEEGPAWREEPPLDVVEALARPYVGCHGNELVRWNVAKMVDFARRGAHGVINAVGQGCMIGTVSAAIARRVRAEHKGMPLVTLYYGATDSDAVRTSLEAFVHQVKQQHHRVSTRAARSSAPEYQPAKP